MNSPVNVLINNIIHAFENTNSISLSMCTKAINSKLVNRQIDYDNGFNKVMAPHGNKKNREIYLQETYLSYLWSLIYSIFVIYEEGVQKPLINNRFNGKIDFTSPLLCRARRLYEWSISLTTNYSKWDEELPNPRNYINDDEKFYTERTNAIFQNAVAFILFHEYAHLTFGHDSYFDATPNNDWTDTQKSERIQLENEADNFAFEMLISSDELDITKLTKGISVIMANISSLLIVNESSLLTQNTHPDLDDRLHRIFIKLNLEEETNQFYCWYLGCLAIRLFLMKHGEEDTSQQQDTAQDAFTHYLELLDELKMRFTF